MSVQLRKPTERTCERCGRTERWATGRSAWKRADGGDRGSPHCIHEWDINGTFYPFEDENSR
ncbi:HEWD family protein [Natrialbaceae archaeon A-CW3]